MIFWKFSNFQSASVFSNAIEFVNMLPYGTLEVVVKTLKMFTLPFSAYKSSCVKLGIEWVQVSALFPGLLLLFVLAHLANIVILQI